MALNKSKYMFFLITMLLLSLCGCAIGQNDITRLENIPPVEPSVQRIRASFAYDPSSLQQEAGICDYVFVATVVEDDGVEYRNTVVTEDENGEVKEIASPYSNYVLQVLENWKGQLITDEEIPVVKHGGISQDGSMLILFEDDQLPEVNKTYLFFGYAQKNGDILISGPNSNLELVDSQARNSSGLYAQYKEAVDNEIVPVERERYKSNYEQVD